MINDPGWQALLARALSRARLRDAMADQHAAAGKPARFKSKSGLAYLVTPDLESAGMWRVTTFLVDGTPCGHMCFNDARAAFIDAIRYSGTVPEEDA